MSYNLLGWTARSVDWEALNARIMPLTRWVEVFPIPRFDDQDTDAVGVSIPAKGVSEESWRDACRIARVLREEFGMTVVDLHTSTVVIPATEQQFRESFIG